MRADRVKAWIDRNKPLILDLPSDAPAGEVDVILLCGRESDASIAVYDRLDWAAENHLAIVVF